MMFTANKDLKKQIIEVGKKLSQLRMVAGSSGNLSCRIDDNNILITSTGSRLGSLKMENILEVNLADPQDAKNKKVTSEFPLHSLIYKNFPNQVIIHCHPALSNGYFAVYSDIKALTFETKLFLGEIPVVIQETPAVSKPEEVVKALKLSNLVALKNHGVVSLANDFDQAFSLVEMLEEAVRTAACARLFNKEILDDLDKEMKEDLSLDNKYEMFSKEHIQAIVDRVNKDEFIAQKGKEMDLTLQYAIRLDDSDKVYKFNFEKGRIARLDFDDNAPFIASAPKEVWEMVFLGKLDPFVAVTQGKMKLKGELGKLARWYVPFSRLFAIFKEVRIK